MQLRKDSFSILKIEEFGKLKSIKINFNILNALNEN